MRLCVSTRASMQLLVLSVWVSFLIDCGVITDHVLHGEIVDTQDEHILQARGHVAQEIRQVVREAEGRDARA